MVMYLYVIDYELSNYVVLKYDKNLYYSTVGLHYRMIEIDSTLITISNDIVSYSLVSIPLANVEDIMFVKLSIKI